MGQLEVLVPVVAASPGPEISECTIFLCSYQNLIILPVTFAFSRR